MDHSTILPARFMNIIGISGLDESVSFKMREIPGLSPRLYRIAQGMDSAAALVTREGIVAAAAEERFNRKKGTNTFPYHAVRYCLEAGDQSIESIDFLAHGFSYEPHRPFFESHDSPFTRKQFDEVYSRSSQLSILSRYFPIVVDWSSRYVGIPHHLAHAASTFYPSGFSEALILIVDGMGELHSTTVAVGRGDEISIVRQIPAPHSPGMLYSVVTIFLGFWPAMDEYKVMGLAPYGNHRRFFDDLVDFMILNPNGTHAIPALLCNETLLDRETYGGTLRLLEEKFGPGRQPDAPIEKTHCDVAAALQAVLQSCLFHLLRHFKAETGQRNLCMAGGVALNCTANGAIRRSRMFRKMFVQPASGDDGTALGAALCLQRLRDPDAIRSSMSLPLWGPSFDEGAILSSALDRHPECTFVKYDSFTTLAAEVAGRLKEGQIIGWFQGRMEFGPRALGSRSILADPRDPDMRNRLNERVKKREAFRPFAPAVPEEDAHLYFEISEGEARAFTHMLYTVHVRAAFREQIASVTHVDGSARIQTVVREFQPRFWCLLRVFGEITGIPILLNTSFNVRGQPIVCTPDEAIITFLSAGLDILVLEDVLVLRR